MIESVSQKIHDLTRKKNFFAFKVIRKTLGKILCSPLMGWLIGVIYKNKIKNGNCIIDTQCATVKNSTKARLFWGVYETAEIDFVKRYLNPEYDVIELGSSLGVLASHVSKIIYPTQKNICVEANPVLLTCLNKNLEFNSINKNFEIINAAIDYKNVEFVEFSISENSLDSHVGFNSKSKQVISVPAITLSQIIERHKINDYTLICDIEGAEMAIFENDGLALNNCKQLHIEMQENEVVDNKIIKIEEVVELLLHQFNFKIRDSFLGAYVFDKI